VAPARAWPSFIQELVPNTSFVRLMHIQRHSCIDFVLKYWNHAGNLHSDSDAIVSEGEYTNHSLESCSELPISVAVVQVVGDHSSGDRECHVRLRLRLGAA
jgi:hypothetical protein